MATEKFCTFRQAYVSTDSKFDPGFYQNLDDFVHGPLEFSDGDIFATIQSYKVPFEP